MSILSKTISILLLLVSSNIYAQQLPVESVEYKQLQAMGYDITSNDKLWSIASMGNGKVAIQKQSDRVVLARYFTRKKSLTQQQELELYKIINKISTDYFYQVGLGDDYIAFVSYLYGPHDPKTFAKIVRYMENADEVLDKFPEMYKLLN
jgi:hypothetical protein